MPAAKSKIPATPAPTTPAPKEDTAPASEATFYRVRKISGFLYEVLEVTVDESKNIPKAVTKADIKAITVAKLADFVCPSVDSKRYKK